MLKKSIRAIAFCLLAAVVLSGCSQSPMVPSGSASETAATAATAGPVTEPATTEPATTEPAATEPAATEPAVTEPSADPVTEQPEPATKVPEPVRYDEASRTYLVTGTDGYESLIFPAADNPGLLQVDDDDFTLIAGVQLLSRHNIDIPDGLPAFIARCGQSLSFLRSYLKENAGDAYPAAADLPVKWQFKSTIREGFKKNSERIAVDTTSIDHREFYWLTALMEKGNTGWEQLGYVWYLATCLDPYCELQRIPVIDPASDVLYTPVCVRAGLDSGVLAPSQFHTFYDAVARYAFENGLTHWGAVCESLPVTAEPVYSRVGSNKVNSGDGDLSAFMAASFVAWLDEQHGPAPLARFVFGQNTFEESFGTDYDTAFGAWKEWIIEQYPLP
ncbi:MAG: hypothetical protein IJK86_02625 [Lachnospiraceae bacterium]|nr:hypothetical protein [Lachnospiraceae bacterium]